MDTKVIRKQILYLAQARKQHNTFDHAFEEGACRKAKEIRIGIRELRKLALKRRGAALARILQEADSLDAALNMVLVGPRDA